MRFLFLAGSFLALNACLLRANSGSISASDAAEAFDEASVSAQASELTSASIDIATNFTIGQAAAQAVQNLESFIASQLPCADIALSGATLTVNYGAKLGTCAWNGSNFSGTQTITIVPTGSGVEVDHTWKNFTNGIVSVSGTAAVTWDATNPSRHVTHDLTWTRIWDGRTGEGTADLTQTPLSGGVVDGSAEGGTSQTFVGFEENGTRTWTGESGTWSLAIDAVDVRWADPIPQSGSYVLTTPSAKSAILAFARLDDTTIRATFTSGTAVFTFKVTETGQSS